MKRVDNLSEKKNHKDCNTYSTKLVPGGFAGLIKPPSKQMHEFANYSRNILFFPSTFV